MLSLIIVNYNSVHLVLNCIRSIYKFPLENLEIIIVDNFSSDNAASLLSCEFPAVKFIQMNYNSGFARANNEGIRQSSGDVVLLLNPDTIILDDAINKCYQRFIKSQYVACGVQLLNEDGSPQITGNYFMTGGLNNLLPLPYFGKFLRSIAFAFKAKKTNVLQASPEQKVDWINGAFLIVQKSAIEKAGLMDEDFFLYAEEIEWCSRLRKIGELVVYGDLKTIHLQGETVKNATQTIDKGYFNLFDKKGLQLIVSNCLRIRKQFGALWFAFHLFIFSMEIPIFFIVGFVDNILHLKNFSSYWQKLKGYTSNVLHLWKLSPHIFLDNPYFYKVLSDR